MFLPQVGPHPPAPAECERYATYLPVPSAPPPPSALEP